MCNKENYKKKINLEGVNEKDGEMIALILKLQKKRFTSLVE
jgi:hypothetical protein